MKYKSKTKSTSNSYLKKLLIVLGTFCLLSMWTLSKINSNRSQISRISTITEDDEVANHYSEYMKPKYTLSPTDEEVDEKKLSDSDQGLTVLMIPHSHCDPGWLYSFEEYFDEQVQTILDNVVKQLSLDSSRRFIWSEVSYFKEWWDLKNKETKDMIRKLVKNKQLEFVGGGWVQNDEAVAQFDDVMDQMTEGMQWLKRTLNVTVEYGWQIDPFGHSSLTPTIMSHAQFKAMVGNRINVFALQTQRIMQEMDFIWQPSASSARRMLVHLLYDHYSYPSEFPLHGSLKARRGMLEDTSYLYFNMFAEMRSTHKTEVLLIPMGNDFSYTNHEDFTFNEELVDYMMARRRQHGIKEIRFATLSEYFSLFNQEVVSKSLTFPLYTHDYLPLVNNFNEPWTGFFTSFTLFKKFVRDASQLVRTTDMFYSMALSKSSTLASTDPAKYEFEQKMLEDLYPLMEESRRMVALTQHHDAVTGTARSHVMKIYSENLNTARQNSFQVLSSSLEYLIHLDGKTDSSSPFEFKDLLDLNAIHPKYGNGDELPSLSLVFHNALGFPKQHHYSLRIQFNDSTLLESIQIIDSFTNTPVLIQIVPIIPNDIKELDIANDYNIIFILDVPAFGINTYFININNKLSKQQHQHKKLSNIHKYNTEKEYQSSKLRILSTKYLTAKFQSNGLLSSITKKLNNNQDYSLSIKETLNQYTTELSGNYIFSPENKTEFKFLEEYKIYVVTGPLLNQVSVVSYGNNVNKTSTMVMMYHRLYDSPATVNYNDNNPMTTEESVELGYSIYGFSNRETVFNFQTDLDDIKTSLYTDNGQESRSRTKSTPKQNSHPDFINYNYYPVLNYAYIKDRDLQFTVFTERSHGVGRNNTSDLEIMIHRTTLQDDGKGLVIPGFDYSRVDAKLYLSVDPPSRMEAIQKQLSLHYSNQPIFLVKNLKDGYNQYLNDYQQQLSFIKEKSLPDNVHIHSIKYFNDHMENGEVLLNIRLAHLIPSQQALDWDSRLSHSLTLSWNQLFNDDVELTKSIQTDISFLPIQNDFVSSNDKYKIKGKVHHVFSTTGQSEFGNNFTEQYLNSVPFIGEDQLSQIDQDEIHLNPLEIKSYQISIRYLNEQFLNSNLKFDIVRLQAIPFNDIYTHDFSIHKVSEFPKFDNDLYPSGLVQ